MVVVPLICALFDICSAEARRFVTAATTTNRKNDQRWRSHIEMPETDEQYNVVCNIESQVRKKLR